MCLERPYVRADVLGFSKWWPRTILSDRETDPCLHAQESRVAFKECVVGGFSDFSNVPEAASRSLRTRVPSPELIHLSSHLPETSLCAGSMKSQVLFHPSSAHGLDSRSLPNPM